MNHFHTHTQVNKCKQATMQNYKKTVLLIRNIIIISCLILLLDNAPAFPMMNPSAVYCTALGFTYTTESTEHGERGVCQLPSGEYVDAWDFLNGKVAQEYSYCAQEGYAISTVNNRARCSRFLTEECGVCVLEDGSEKEVTELMELNFQETTCGDSTCGNPENYATCPEDCPSGSIDDYCDGISDGKCDLDCLQGEDADCIDTDSDGVPDILDNCPTLFNREQADYNGDGVGDVCRHLPLAQCKDVTVRADENCQGYASINDGSYHPNGDPITIVQNPTGPYNLGDTMVTLTVSTGSGADSSCSGTVTVYSPDSDGDGTLDCNDLCPNDSNKTQPGLCGCGVADIDTDADGTPDCNDGCPNDSTKVAPGACGCEVADTDTDGDGTPDCNDGCPNDSTKVAPGICGCGIADTDSDSDGTPDCVDGCPNDSNKIAPGACGCGTADTDTDGDGVADCVDNCPAVRNPDQADSNNNGIGDACEAATSKQICSILGNDPKPSIRDQDIFKFSGNKGEKVTIRLEASPPDAGIGKRATLILTDNIKKVRLVTLDRSELPNEITKKLPATGEYLITVAQPISATKDKRYAGGYCLTLQTTTDNYQTLAPYLGVE